MLSRGKWTEKQLSLATVVFLFSLSPSAQIKKEYGGRKLIHLLLVCPSLSQPSGFTVLLLMMISILTLESVFRGFCHWLETNTSSGIIQALRARFELLRHPALRTEQLLWSPLLQYVKTTVYIHSANVVPLESPD